MFSRALLLLAGVSVLLPAKGGQTRYDPDTEVTVTGTVDVVDEHAHLGMASMGMHLALKTAEGVYDVHLGPLAFVKREGMTFTQGDVITVTGSKVPYGRAEAILAREVKKGEKTLVLRNQKGIPQWNRGRLRT